MKANDPRKQVREEPSDLAQEGTFGFYPSELLEEREGEDFGIRELLEGGVVSSSGVERGVGVVDPAKQYDYRLFQEGEPCSTLGMGHLILLWAGSQMVSVLSHQPRNRHLVRMAKEGLGLTAQALFLCLRISEKAPSRKLSE
jgi:hypothetical protein